MIISIRMASLAPLQTGDSQLTLHASGNRSVKRSKGTRTAEHPGSGCRPSSRELIL